MNTAVSITSTTHYWQQHDADAPDESEARQAALADYVDDWARGNLYDDGEVYSRPQERLMDDDWLAQLLTARNDEELLAVSKIVKAKLRQFVEEQAGDLA